MKSKGKWLLFIFVFTLSIAVRAQFFEILPGYYITNRNDTIQVKIKVPITEEINVNTGERRIEVIYNELNGRFVYIDSLEKKIKVKPKDAKEFGFTYNKKNIRYLSRPYILDFHKKNLLYDKNAEPPYVFLRLIGSDPGYLKVFECIEEIPLIRGSAVNSNGLISPNNVYSNKKQYIFQKGEGRLFQPEPMHFAAQMSSYFSDYVDLSVKIANKEYTLKDMLEIAEEYNVWKANEERKIQK